MQGECRYCIHFPVSHRDESWSHHEAEPQLSTKSCEITSVANQGVHTITILGFSNEDLIVMTRATQDVPHDPDGVHLGGLLFSPSEIDTIKCQLLIKLHKIEEDTDEWEWLSALVEFINQTLLLEFEKSVISEPF